MESSNSSSPFDSFKSKKILHSPSTEKPSPSDQTTCPDSGRSPWNTITPEKPAFQPRRVRRSLMSVKEVREAAAKLQSSDKERKHQPDPICPVGVQIGLGNGEIPTRERRKKADESMKLPEKCEMLCKFFDSLHSSIRLLRLKGSMSTFTKISPQIECLTDRRFSYSHLAQLKFILPEVFELKKVLVRDERTCCMKPDLHVSMNVNAIKNDAEQKSVCGNSALRKMFRARLLDFVKAHPEEEVPEGLLPEPFDRSKINLNISTMTTTDSTLLNVTLTEALAEKQPTAASHLSHSFRKHFSKQVSFSKAVVSPAQSITESCAKTITNENCISVRESQASVTSAHLPATPMKEIDSVKNAYCSSVGTSTVEGTPAKAILTPGKLMSATPALPPPKRCYMSLDDDDSSSSRNNLTRRPLKFGTPVKKAKDEDEVNNFGGLSSDNDIFDILPDNLLQSIREKERKLEEENDPAISQAKRRQQIIASLPKLFDRIRYFFQSIKHSVVTKEELLHRILTSHLDIVDRREVEEQLKLLQELVPEWIYEKKASSGDLLIGINKISNPESMRARLVEAK